jgi:flagellar hook-associated protein 1 FlgK
VAGLFSLLSLARDGVLAQTAALQVTGQNVAGANTAGFVKRTPTIEAQAGGGVQMSGSTRSFDRFTYTQLVSQTSLLSAATSRATAISNVEVLVAPSTDHLGDRTDALFNAFQNLALNPSDTAARSSVIASAQWLASGFSETANGLQAFRDELGTNAHDVVGQVNDLLASVAKADQSIISARARGEDANDLLDTRDRLVQEISARVGARAVENPNGGLTIFGAGTVLFEGGAPAKLTSTLDTNGNLHVEADRGGNSIDVTSTIASGTLAGIRQARDTDIPGLLTNLDAYAKDVTDAINAVHSQGFSLDGTTGHNLFAPMATTAGAAHAMALDPSILDHPERIAASGTTTDLPGGNDVAVQLANLARVPLPGGATASERYASLAAKVGVLRSVTEADQSMRTDTVATATSLRESTSGVSTDEEMITMQQFQRSFEASTRVLKTVDQLFDSLLAIVT